MKMYIKHNTASGAKAQLERIYKRNDVTVQLDGVSLSGALLSATLVEAGDEEMRIVCIQSNEWPVSARDEALATKGRGVEIEHDEIEY